MQMGQENHNAVRTFLGVALARVSSSSRRYWDNLRAIPARAYAIPTSLTRPSLPDGPYRLAASVARATPTAPPNSSVSRRVLSHMVFSLTIGGVHRFGSHQRSQGHVRGGWT